MLASTETMSPPTQAGLYFDPPVLERAPFTTGLKPQPSLKKHKVLPRPKQSPLSVNPKPTPHPLSVDTTLSSVSSSSSRSGTTTSTSPAPSRRDVRVASGPDPPPTPPAHSRTSSSGHSVQPPSPTHVETPVKNVASNPDAQKTPGTPPNQRSPPTPDVTPPQQARRPKAFRPSLADRMPSKATNDSRNSSFTTARETPSSDEDEKATLRKVSSGRTSSQNTVRQVSDQRNNKKTQEIGLGLGLESDDNTTPTPESKQKGFAFDKGWGSGGEVEQEWDANLNRNVTVRKRRKSPNKNKSKDRHDKPVEVVEDELVTPTNATKALRTMPLHQRMHVASSPPRESAAKDSTRWAAPSASASSVGTDVKRFSGMSSKSTVSTVVEAILVEAPPQRRKTLRHVKKQLALRDSGSDVSQASSAANSTVLEESSRRLRPRGRPSTARTDSLASTGTTNSLSSRKARRDIIKNGGIPVVVIPDRKASVKGAATPSLRSTSSRRSQRSNSLGSVPLSGMSTTKDRTPVFDRPTRRSRAMSESDGSLPGDQRTIDYPPIVPIRSSSLSAPTSRNGSVASSRAGSRSGSLTSESLKAHNTFVQDEQQRQRQQQQQLHQALQKPPRVKVERAPSVEYVPAESDFRDERQLQPAPSAESHRDAHDQRSLVDHNGDPFFGKRLTTQNTPFSIASVETNGTHSAAEVSEAMAVNIYPHQNRSVVMVDHTSKILDANSLQTGNFLGDQDGPLESEQPNTTTTASDGVPVTPPQPIFTVNDVDSPLRNPRAPPEPPVIQFIPATPSGLTPAAEKMKMLGNYFEETPEKRPSVLKRAFSVRKSDADDAARSRGFLTRTFSLSRNLRKGNVDNSQRPALYRYPTDDSIPDEGRLHPHWRPLSSQWNPATDEDWVHDIDNGDEDAAYRYPPVDNRPSARRPSLSSRMKRTFAILPITDDAHYTSPDGRAPERRTIKRTPSGNLRVMRYRDSLSSMRWGRRSSEEGRPSTAPGSSSSTAPGSSSSAKPSRRTWGVEKRFDAQGRRFFPGWQEKLESYSLQGLGRRLSERKRQKRSQELRSKISGPREVRDGVGEVIKRNSYKGPSYQASPHFNSVSNTGMAVQQQQYTRQRKQQQGPRGFERTPTIQAQV